MKLSHVMIATLALGASAAQAQITHLTGASASRNNVVLDLKGLCTGTFKVQKNNNNNGNDLGNVFTAICTVPFTGTSILEARFNAGGGSLNAVLKGPAPYATGTAQTFLPSTAGCTNVSPAPGQLLSGITVEFCSGAALTAATPSEGGYMDVEGAIFKGTGVLSGTVPPDDDFIASSFGQTFGIAVTKSLYEAMQAYQTANGDQIPKRFPNLPAVCATKVVSGPNTTYTATGSTTPECQPSMSRADFAAMSVSGANYAKRSGANWFVGGVTTGIVGGPAPTASDLPANVLISPAVPLNTKFFLERRQTTSGTQAAAQLYFLANPIGNSEAGGAQPHVGNDTTAGASQNSGANFTVFTRGSSTDVITNLGSTTEFRAGVLSMENNPLATGSNYRFVKINGASGSEGTAAGAQTTEAIAGRYDFWYRTFKYCPGGVCAALLDALDNGVAIGASSPGIFRATESNYQRKDGKATNPVVSK